MIIWWHLRIEMEAKSDNVGPHRSRDRRRQRVIIWWHLRIEMEAKSDNVGPHPSRGGGGKE